MMFFEQPKYLFLLLLLIVFFVVELINILKLKNIFHDKKLNEVTKKKFLKVLFYALSFVCLILALATPSFGTKQITQKQNGTEVFFLLDVSNSMNVKDTNMSRLAISKALIKIINSNLETIPTGLILFKGTSVLSLPLTKDKNIFGIMLDTISSESLTSAGSNLEKAINLSIKSFSSDNSIQKIILLFTDGDESLGNLNNTIKNLNEKNIACIFVGVGTLKGTEIEVLDENKNKKLINTKLYEQELKNFISQLYSKDSFYCRYDEINLSEKISEKVKNFNTELKSITTTEKQYRTNELIFLSLVFLIIGFVNGEYQIKNKVMVFAVFLLCSCSDVNMMITNYFATQNLKNENYNLAVEKFYKISKSNIANKKLKDYATYNLALCYLRMGESVSAEKKFTELTSSDVSKLKALSFFQLGVKYFKEKKYSTAIGDFKNAIAIDNNFIDAKINYELCLRLLKSEEQENRTLQNKSLQNKNEETILDYIKQKETQLWKTKNQKKKEITPYDY